MNADNGLILEQAESFYNVRPVRDIRMGVTGNRIFEVERAQTAYILRASAYSPEKKSTLRSS